MTTDPLNVTLTRPLPDDAPVVLTLTMNAARELLDSICQVDRTDKPHTQAVYSALYGVLHG